jgi:hypothetical protein
MESISEILACPVCYTQFNYSNHEPFVLLCGHNLCKSAIKKLYHNEHIECPICRKECKYERKEDIGKNYTLLKMIKTMKTQSFLNIPENPFNNIFAMNQELKLVIDDENKKIKKYFDQILECRDNFINYNKGVLKAL